MKLVFQSSTIDVLPLKRTSIDFILSKNNEKPKLPGNSRTELELVGQSRLELLTSPLSGVCSNQLSYKP